MLSKPSNVFYYSASAESCLRICLKASRYMLSKPSKAQATPLTAFSSSCEMENREQQNGFSTLFKIVTVKETGIQGFSQKSYS